MRLMLIRKRTKEAVGLLLNSQGELLTEDTKTDLLNSYFASIFMKQ